MFFEDTMICEYIIFLMLIGICMNFIWTQYQILVKLQKRNTTLQKQNTTLQKRNTTLLKQNTTLQRRNTTLQKRNTTLQNDNASNFLSNIDIIDNSSTDISNSSECSTPSDNSDF